MCSLFQTLLGVRIDTVMDLDPSSDPNSQFRDMDFRKSRVDQKRYLSVRREAAIPPTPPPPW
jgi:hypothetical protein